MGNVLDTLGRAPEAIESYERALAINPGYAEVHYNLGLLAEKQGQNSQAAASMRRAVEINPKFAQAHIHLAGSKRFRAARGVGGQPSPRVAYRARIHRNSVFLAMVLLSSGKSPEALELIVRMLEQ